MKRFDRTSSRTSNRLSGEEALVVAFDSTASALAFASAAPGAQLEGRLIPVPRTLSAGCGMAWRELPANRAQVEALICAQDIDDAQLVLMRLR